MNVPRAEKIIIPLAKVFLAVVGGFLTAYTWVSTFYDLPPLIQDWRWGLGLGIVLLLGGLGWTLADVYRRYVWWAEPELTLTTNVSDDFADGSLYRNARLSVSNNEETEIAECYATLEYAAAYIEQQDREFQDPRLRKQRLRWSQSGLANDKCEISIPPRDSREVNLAHTKRGLEFLLCGRTVQPNFMLGTRLYLIKIRIDGKLNGKAIKPEFFEGYLFNQNEAMLFHEGDWKKDEHVPIRRPQSG